VHLLIAIIAIPVLGLPGFAWTIVHERNEQARTAAGTTVALQSVRLLDELRYAVWSESAGMSVPMFTSFLTLTPAQKAALPGRMLDSDPDALARATDMAVTALRRDRLTGIDGGLAEIEQLTTQLPALRGQSLEARRPGTSKLAGALAILSATKGYSSVTSGLIELERKAIRRVSNGDLGSSSAAQLRADMEIRAVGDLVLQVNRQQISFFELNFSAVAGRPLLNALRDSSGVVNVLSENLAEELSPQLRPIWEEVVTDPEVVRFREAVAAYVEVTRPDLPQKLDLSVSAILRTMTVASGSIAFSDRMSTLMTEAVRIAADQARDDRAQAVVRSRLTLIGALGVVLMSVTMLLVVGGLIRRRLRDLATSAQELSAGRFEVMEVRGPREVAVASEGLNDAVHGLREITMKAGLIAQGDLTAPALEQPSPGPLGAALHASFERVVQVIRERETLQQQLAHDASHDSLTGLPNRAEAESQLQAALVRAHGAGSRVALLFVDLDHFKQVNDEHGHHAGDEVLRVAAERMAAQVRGSDLVCRLGGDEFVVILNDVTPATAAATGERIVEAVRAPIPYGVAELAVGASVGIAVWPEGDAPPRLAEDHARIAEDLLTSADRAVYRAKAAGRNTAVF
jgi:diguanylate cyclase (GGDEF)-like protein